MQRTARMSTGHGCINTKTSVRTRQELVSGLGSKATGQRNAGFKWIILKMLITLALDLTMF